MQDYLTERKAFKNLDETKFYAANMLQMLDYIHKKNLAHRDFRPANIMIEKNGYLKLFDFDTAKVIKDFTHTIIGSPHYMAPEVILGQGYSLSCDYWSLGICLYEIYYGYKPFGRNCVDILNVYKEILNKYYMC